MAVDHPSRTLDEEGLAFFGRITAGQCHEVTNVLNVINELAGLQLDLLRAGATGARVNLDRLLDIAERIQRQVVRGELIVRNINRFAHSVDVPVVLFDLRELVASVVFLAERTAHLCGTELAADLPAETVAVESNPFCLQQALWACIDMALQAASVRRCVTVSYRVLDGGAEVGVESSDPITCPDPSRLALIQLLASDLGVTVVALPGSDNTDRSVLFVPKHRLLPGLGVQTGPLGDNHAG